MTLADFMQTTRSFQDSRVLLSALELDIFTAVGSTATASEVATRCATNPRATEMLLNALVAIGVLSKKGGTYANDPELVRFLSDGSPQSMRLGMLHTANLWRTWSTLTDCVRTGSAVDRPGVEGEKEDWTRNFIAAMHNNSLAQAGPMVRAVGAASVRRLLDIGGGSGAYSIAFAKANPQLEAVVVDLAHVLPIAEGHIAAAGLSGRVATRPGDLTRDDFGGGFDLALLSAICHMLGPDENLDLLRRCRQALVVGGRLVIREFLLDSDKTSPKPAALFSINMLCGTRSGASYSEEEYRDWLTRTGFAPVVRPDPAGDLLIATAA